MIHETLESLRKALADAGVIGHEAGAGKTELAKVRDTLIDDLIRTGVFSSDEKTRDAARDAIHVLARQCGAIPCSIQGLYEAIGRGELKPTFTVPAHNIRTMTYDICRRLFRAAIRNDVGPFIFEIARSEIGYTEQRPAEYAACVLAAAVKEGYQGPVFIQGDHFQASVKRWTGGEKEKEQKAIEALIDEALAAEFYNIDIDTSTLVDLSQPTIPEQQRPNFEGTAHFTRYIREREPKGIEVSIGGEIGEVGKSNTSPEEFRAYIDGFRKLVPAGTKGVSKVSIQTGTSHGGVVMPDGSIAKVSIDFGTLRTISDVARSEYGIGGAVQHGASTLSEDVFDEFPKADTLEIHLATAFQNMVYDHPSFPSELHDEIADWCRANLASERKEKDTEEQFVYKSRKKALGPFKRRIWDLPSDRKEAILDDIEKKFAFLMDKLGVYGTKEIIQNFVSTEASASRPEFSSRAALQPLSALVVEGEGE
ncbi:MAG: class II fructose-bisphosphate aldolase [Thermoanaerobaculia bacterium]